jgi:hypothetical protein
MTALLFSTSSSEMSFTTAAGIWYDNEGACAGQAHVHHFVPKELAGEEPARK